MATADAQASFTINLVDGTSGPAASAASALDSLKRSIEADTKELAALQRMMRNLQGGTVVNVKQFQELKEKIDAKKQAIAQNTSSVIALGGSLTKSASSGKALKSMLEQLTQASQAAPGPLSGIVARLGGIKGMLAGGALALGIAAVGSAFVALAAGAVAATAALLKYGIAQADAARSELLRLEGLTKIRNSYGIAAGSASELQETIDRVAASTALGRDQVARYAEQLYRAHLRGQDLSDALEGVAIKATVQGEKYAQAFASMAAGAALAGGSVRKLSDDAKARLGGIAARQMLSLDVQTRKLRESWSALFSGLKIEGLLKALSMVTSLFSQNTATGRALKTMIEGLFQPMIAAIEFLGPVVKRFFQGMVIGALLFTIALLSVRNWFRKTFGDSLKDIDLTKAGLYAGVFAVSMLAGGLVALAIAAALVAAPFVAAGLAIWGLYEGASQAYRFISDIDWAGLGTSIVDGIVGGLKRGASWVIDTIKGLGTAAWKTFKSALGIASPSRVFAQLGLAIPQGVQVGIETGAPALNRTVGRVVEVPLAPSIATPEQAPTGDANTQQALTSNRTVSVQVGEIHVHTTADKAAEIATDIKRELERVLEGVAVQLGAAP